ncbi:MAG: hypothetical protein PHC62_00080 [Candidatus Izemoplasmatales bacterium]|nr:hypothetical protein [Candidatus Izemoplasmatales bacterium]
MAKLFDFETEMDQELQRISNKEQILGKTLMQPFAANNSGSRKNMFCIQVEHSLPLLHSEVPFIQTGYENSFGDYSSSIIKAKSDYEVLGKVTKFSTRENHHYYLLIRDTNTNELGVIERVSYNHITETYGYLYNNSAIDILKIGDTIQQDDIIRESEAFDEYGNRCDGVNLLTTYVAMEKNMEDGIVISESACKKLGSPLIKRVTVIFNDNDFPLNIHGSNEYYKAFPEIGEGIESGILCCIRRDNTDEALYTQSWDNLQRIMTSDEKITVEGDKIIDINIFTNNPETLKERSSYEQLLKYYNEKRRFLEDFTSMVQTCMNQYGTSRMSEDLQKLYFTSLKELDEKKYLRDNKVYTGTIVEFIVLENNYPHIGDKLSNRYGGKGVISEIRPDELMARTETGEIVDLYFNQATCINRLNDGQLKEQSLSMISKRIINFLNTNTLTADESLGIILDFIGFVSKTQEGELRDLIEIMDDIEKEFFVNAIKNDPSIYLSIKPMTESVSLDDLNAIYQTFPWIDQYELYSPLQDSNGNYRYIKSMRKATCGYLYIYRLKQYAEEKFSVTNLSATNLRNENTRSKANKNYRATHQNTPIRFGDMESGDLSHLGMETFVEALLIYSLSPIARNEMEDLWTSDPFNINIQLGPDCKNRSVEILNTYFKQIGLQLIFEKHEKKITFPIQFAPYVEIEKKDRSVISFVETGEQIDPEKYVKTIDEIKELDKRRLIKFAPIRYKDDEWIKRE